MINFFSLFKKTIFLNVLINLKFLIGITSQLILVRYITPSEFGKFAIIIILSEVLFSINVVDQTAMIRYQTEKFLLKTSSVLCNYGANLILIISSSVCIFLYVFEKIDLIILVFSLIILFSRWIKYRLIVVEGALEQKLEYQKLYLNYFYNSLFSNIFCIYFAYIGFGIYALILREILEALIYWFLIRKSKPRLDGEFDKKTANLVSKFALQGALINFLNIFQFKGILLFLGAFANLSIVGFFERAHFLNFACSNFFSQLIDRVFVPLVGNKKDGEDNKNTLLNIFLLYKIYVFLPVGITTFFFGESICMFLLGNEWKFTGEIISILSVWLIFTNLNHTLERWIFIHHTRKYSIIGSIITLLILAIVSIYVYFTKEWITLIWGLNIGSIIFFIILISIIFKRNDRIKFSALSYPILFSILGIIFYNNFYILDWWIMIIVFFLFYFLCSLIVYFQNIKNFIKNTKIKI